MLSSCPLACLSVFAKAPVHSSGLLDTGDGQRIFWEESGTPTGVPALYLHGGPGGTLGAGGYRARFDPEVFRIVGFDQRGCGRSTPLVTATGYDLSQNTTHQLVRDIERLREHLGVTQWLLNGVSWGSTLAMAYAQQYPHRVSGIVLMAVTTTSRSEVEWITETVGAIFPEAWDRLANYAETADPQYERGRSRIVDTYARLMTSSDPTVRDAASRPWADWEDHHVSLGSDTLRRNPRWDDDDYRHCFATLVTHYWSRDGFLDPPILERTQRLAGIPGTLIHGRRDVSGPLVTAWRVHQSWADSELIVDEGGGHGGPSMAESMCAANSRHATSILGTDSTIH
jgi:proline iminopeptidase